MYFLLKNICFLEMEDESEPLLTACPPPTYESVLTRSYDVSFSPSAPRRIPVIECRVCHATIDCTGRLNVCQKYFHREKI